MKANPVGWFEIYVNDLDRARIFYETVLDARLAPIGDKTNDNFKMLAFPSNFDVYGASGALVYLQGFKAGGNSTLVYFSCADCAIEESRIVSAGGKIQKPKMSIGEYGFIALGIDTEGNMFGLHSQK